MINRTLSETLRDLARHYPVVTLTGPRQSGKTTLCRALFGHLSYVSLEPLDTRGYARSDPRGFLAERRDGAIIDEVQHVPDLLSYIQASVDEDPRRGRFVLTGSQHFGLLEAVAQSLAGRTAIVHLLPLGLEEVRRFGDPLPDLWTILWSGSYPRIHDRKVPAGRWLMDYVTTFVQRDVRQVLNVVDLEAFNAFVRSCAARTATEVNLSALGSDVGVTYNTARAWLSVLEAGFVVFRVPPYRRSVRKQIVKAPKLHFVDSGLACTLLGITEPAQLRHHPLRGQVFESWVAAEIRKARVHRGLDPGMWHYRDAKRLEVDLVVERASGTVAVEAKSAATIASDFFDPLRRFAESVTGDRPERTIVYGGDERARRQDTLVVPWHAIQDVDWT